MSNDDKMPPIVVALLDLIKRYWQNKSAKWLRINITPRAHKGSLRCEVDGIPYIKILLHPDDFREVISYSDRQMLYRPEFGEAKATFAGIPIWHES